MTSEEEDSPSPLDLREDISRMEDYQEEGYHRIEKFYSVDEAEDPTAITGLEEPPHYYLLEDAVEAIKWTIEVRESDDGFVYDRFSWNHLFYTQFAIGTEWLLSAIVLKHDPEYYFNNSGPRDTPNFGELRNKILGLVSNDLNGFQKKRIVDVIDILRVHRNNRVHLNFHNHSHSNHPPRIYETLAFLISYFFEAASDVVARLIQLFQKKDSNHYGLEYSKVDFPMQKSK